MATHDEARSKQYIQPIIEASRADDFVALDAACARAVTAAPPLQKHDLAFAYDYWSSAKAHLGQHAKSIELGKRGMELNAEVDWDAPAARTSAPTDGSQSSRYSMMALSAQALGSTDEARAFATKALEHANRTGDPERTATVTDLIRSLEQPKPSSGGCFIATAVYGDQSAPEVERLRDFRERSLMPSRVGRSLVHAYYRLSPPLARWLQRHRQISDLIGRRFLTPLVQYLDDRQGPRRRGRPESGGSQSGRTIRSRGER